MDTFDETLSQTTSPRRAGGMTDDLWGPWTRHAPGPCPIPDVKAGFYSVRFCDGDERTYKNLTAFQTAGWVEGQITHYRLRLPAVDWEALAREAVKMLSNINCPLNASFNAGSEEREGGSTRRQGKELDVVTAFRRDVHAFLDRARKAGVS